MTSQQKDTVQMLADLTGRALIFRGNVSNGRLVGFAGSDVTFVVRADGFYDRAEFAGAAELARSAESR